MSKIKKIKSEAKDIVLQSNSLLEAPKDLNLLEYKLFLMVVSKINPEADIFPVFKVTAEEFAKVIGASTTKSVYCELQMAADRLITRVACVHYPELNKTVKINLTSKAIYLHGEGAIEIHLSDAIRPFLLNLSKEFTQYKLSNICRLSSLYAIRLYELLKEQENFGKRIFSIPEFRSKLGVADKQYTRFSDLKLRVLDIALREINNKTDLTIKFEFQKTRQKITGIKVDIRSNSKRSIYSEDRPPLESVKKIMGMGYSFLKAVDISNQADERVIDNAIEAVTEQIEKGKVRDSQAMLQTAIQEKWVPPKKKTPQISKKTASEKKQKKDFEGKVKASFLSKLLSWIHSSKN